MYGPALPPRRLGQRKIGTVIEALTWLAAAAYSAAMLLLIVALA